MPNIKSAAKRLRQDKKRAVFNSRWRRRYRMAVRVVRENPTAESLRTAQKELDKAAQRKVIKKNKAARLKSRLSRLVHDRS